MNGLHTAIRREVIKGIGLSSVLIVAQFLLR